MYHFPNERIFQCLTYFQVDNPFENTRFFREVAAILATGPVAKFIVPDWGI
jgi:hypothetical protein